jgi:hypothetical protein
MSLKNKLNSLLFYFKPRKVVAHYKLFLGDEWLEISVDSVAPYVYKVVLLVSDTAWGGDRSIQGDNMDEIIDRLISKHGEKIVVVRGSWDNQLKQVTAGLDYIKQHIPEATHFMYVDSDEVYLEHQIEDLLSLIKQFKYYNRAIRIQYNMYFKSIYYKIEPKKWATAMVLFPIRSYTRFLSERNTVTCKIIDLPEMDYEHYAYIRKDDESIRKKLIAHQNSIEPILPNWYDDIWLNWSPELRNFHPTQPNLWEYTVKVNEDDIPEKVKLAYSHWSSNSGPK